MASRKPDKYYALPPTKGTEARQQARERLSRDTEAFIKKGGAIRTFPPGASGRREGGRQHIVLNPHNSGPKGD